MTLNLGVFQGKTRRKWSNVCSHSIPCSGLPRFAQVCPGCSIVSIDAWHHHRGLSNHGSLRRNHNAEPFPSALLPELSPNQGGCSTSWPLGTEERALSPAGRSSPKPHSQETFVRTARGIDSLIWSEAYAGCGLTPLARRKQYHEWPCGRPSRSPVPADTREMSGGGWGMLKRETPA